MTLWSGWGASGRWFKSSRPDHLKAPESLGSSEAPGPSPFPAPDGLTTGSPSRTTEPSAADLLREAISLLEGGVVRLGDLREILLRALDALARDREAPK